MTTTGIVILTAIVATILFAMFLFIVWCTICTGSLRLSDAVDIAPRGSRWFVRRVYNLDPFLRHMR